MLKKITKADGDLQWIANFYSRHYEAPDYLIPSLEDIQSGNFYAFYQNSSVVAFTHITYPSPFLMKTASTVVHKDLRGQGIGTQINEELELKAIDLGVTKITTHIYVDNLPSIILKLKRGYLVEGLLRNHDEQGKDEYVLGKEII